MPLPKTIKPAAQYAITIFRPVLLPDGSHILPSHDEIMVSGEVLKVIKDQVANAVERIVPEPVAVEPVSDFVRQMIGPAKPGTAEQASSETASN